jgi:hypothetical protein
MGRTRRIVAAAVLATLAPAARAAAFTLSVSPAEPRWSQRPGCTKKVGGVGPWTSRADKVTAVQGYLEVNDEADARSTLTAFIHQVNALGIGRTLAAS